MPPNEPARIGFYDVDSRDDPLAPGPGYKFRPRVLAVSANLTRLLRVAETHGVTIVTRCLHVCGSRSYSLAIEEGTLTIPMTSPPQEVGDLIRERRGEIIRIEFERRTCGKPEENARQRASDVFHVNPGASAAIEALGVDRWIVFGTSLPGCLQLVIGGLLNRGQDVTVASDAIWDVPRVFENFATEELQRAITGGEAVTQDHVPAFVAAYLDQYRQMGAKLAPTRDILEEIGASCELLGSTASKAGRRP